MNNARAAIFAVLLFFASALTAVAQDVTLTSRDGGIEISGNLLGFDGEFYRLDTVYGELTIDGSGVTCEGPGCPDLVDFVAEVRLSGAAAMGEVMMPALLSAFAQRNGFSLSNSRESDVGFTFELVDSGTQKVAARFIFSATTTDEGFADLLANQADVVLSMREIRPEERKLAREAGMGDLSNANRSRVLALDAIVPVVAPDNPVRTIDPQSLALAFGGKITNWALLGGPDAPISLHLPDLRTGLGQSVEDRILAPAALSLAKDIAFHRISLDLADAVSADPFALGIASYAETGNAQVLNLKGPCGFEIRATRRNIKTEDYPLTSPMFAYLPARRLPKIGREFLGFLRSPMAQIVIRRAGFVDQTPEEISIEAQGQRFANAISSAGPEIRLEELQRMITTLSPMKRLTTSFRFETGSVRLDAQSRSNVQQLAQAIEQGQYDAHRLLFVGFSDGEGSAEPNRDIALRRADAVRRAVSEAAEAADLQRLTLDLDAFGEALPMACDDSSWGRQTNRRVEVWVR
ncbi:MAG: phosphate ABC transporter substrate-binding/OmpA family protein [Pseudomonadota bacterium]